MNWLILILLLFPPVLLFFLKTAHGDKTVQTESGPIRGTTVASGKVEAFLGVPFAEPPVGSLRFAKPVPKVPWKDVYDATQLPPPCIQGDYGKAAYVPDITNMTEDCLYLNLWVPQGKDEKKPIILFIHGGGLILGSSNIKLYDGARLAEYGDVIVVTINYRLGALGYFAGYIDEAPGNMGMYDQVMAIQWIKENAEHFHGDPDNIVLMGESSGACSISMHQVSPLSKNLFNRAILQSGSAVLPVYDIDNKQRSRLNHMYAEMVGCISDNVTIDSNPKSIVECMRNIPAEKFSGFDMEFAAKNSMYLLPRHGDDFLPENIIDSFRKGHFKNTEVLMGINRDEGTLLLFDQAYEFFRIFKHSNVSDLFNETLAMPFIKLYTQSGDEAEDEKLVQGYLNRVNSETGYTYLKATSDILGDFVINCAAVFQAEFQSFRDVPVYFYVFDYRSSSTVNPEWVGVTHFDEVQYVFGNPMYNDFTEREMELSRDIMDMWVTFARKGNPNIPGGQEWPRYTYNDPRFYIIGGQDRLGSRPDSNRCELWRKRFRSVIDDDFIQTPKPH